MDNYRFYHEQTLNPVEKSFNKTWEYAYEALEDLRLHTGLEVADNGYILMTERQAEQLKSLTAR